MSNQDVVTVNIENENEEVQTEEPKKNIIQQGIDFVNEHKAVVIGAVVVAVSAIGMFITKNTRHRLGSGDDCEFDDGYNSDEYYDDDFDDDSIISDTDDSDK